MLYRAEVSEMDPPNFVLNHNGLLLAKGLLPANGLDTPTR